jgi:protoheme IX farnesyltransferase
VDARALLALALLLRDDYARSGVPMLPVVRGVGATVNQIAAYAVATVIVSLVPSLVGSTGWLYLATALVLGAVLMIRSARLYVRPDIRRARELFRYSMVYLALVFLVLAVDRSFVV